MFAAAVMVIGIAAAAAAFFGFVGVAHVQLRNPGGAMDPTIPAGASVTMAEVGGDQVHRGDIVVFRSTAWPDSIQPESLSVKRVIGIGGDSLATDAAGHLGVDGKAVTEPYTRNDGEDRFDPFTVEVAPGNVFVAGDWRTNSRDSRLYVDGANHGGIPVQDVVGIVVAVNGKAITPTTAFTDAGLAGAPYRESGGQTRTLVLAGGLAVFLGGLIWFVLALARRQRATV